jgi:carbohydrate diacid regulator
MAKNIENNELREKCLNLFSSKNIFYNCGPELINEYKKVFVIKSVNTLLSDEDLVKTATLFFENSLNISTASKVGFMHRNTLIYRLDKIQKLIGLDIRNFNDAVVFENLLLFYEMIQAGEQN